jgi:hypothetical protein
MYFDALLQATGNAVKAIDDQDHVTFVAVLDRSGPFVESLDASDALAEQAAQAIAQLRLEGSQRIFAKGQVKEVNDSAISKVNAYYDGVHDLWKYQDKIFDDWKWVADSDHDGQFPEPKMEHIKNNKDLAAQLEAHKSHIQVCAQEADQAIADLLAITKIGIA